MSDIMLVERSNACQLLFKHSQDKQPTATDILVHANVNRENVIAEQTGRH